MSPTPDIQFQFTCMRCGHMWLRRRLDQEPVQCPKCRSPYWNRERIRKPYDSLSWGKPPTNTIVRLREMIAVFTDDCIPWYYGNNADGYGRVTGSKTGENSANRVVWVITHGKPIPLGKMILHKCDFPPCINPRHLFLGDNKANMEDRSKKRRGAEGEASVAHKLTDEQVREIRAIQGESLADIGKRYGVTRQAISYIRRGETRKVADNNHYKPMMEVIYNSPQ